MAPQPDLASPGHELSLESARNLGDNTVASLVPLNGLSRSQRRELLRASTVVVLAAGTEVGLDDVGYDQMVYILEGTIELRRAGKVIAKVAAGTDDARFGLGQLRARDVTAFAVGPVRLLRLDISLVSTLLLWAQSAAAAGLAPAGSAGSVDEDEVEVEWLPQLLSSELFSSIPSANLHRVFEVMEPLTVPAGEVVVRQGEPGVYYYVVRRGHFEVTRQPSDGEDAYHLAELGPGDSFGEEALVSESRRNATVTARSDGELLRLTKEDFVTLIVQPALQLVEHARAEAMVGDGARWLDVRLPDEHGNDGLASSINIPLHELRTRREELPRDGRYVVYCDTGRRSAAACALLRGWGLEAYLLAGGLLDRAPDSSSRGGPPEGSEPRLKEELARADAELEAALRLKVEATAARRIFAAAADRTDDGQAHTDRERARLRAKLKRLELESHAAGQALSQAQRRRLEAEAALRAEAAAAEKARAEAAARVERLQASTEEKMRAEQARIGEVYAKGEARIGELQAQRRALEAEFEQERVRMEAELAARLEAIQREATDLRGSMARTREEGKQRAAALRREQDAAAENVRSQAEQRLRAQRERLEAGFADATRQIEAARRRMDELRGRREEADREARELATALREAADERRRAAQAEWEAEQARLRAAVDGARSRAEEARTAKDTAEAERRALYEELERLRVRSGRNRDSTPRPATTGAPGEATLSRSLAQQEARVAAAQGAVDRAEQAHRDAQSAADAAVAKEAQESAAEKELRLRLYAEAESWLEEEKARSDRELQSARAQLEAMQRARFEAEARKLTERTQDLSMISDIRAQLEAAGTPDALARAMGNKAYAERQAAAVKSAREIAAQERHAAEGELERARAHIERLQRRQHPSPETDPEDH